MKERLQALLEKVKETTKNLSSKVKKIIIIGVAISILAAIGIAVMLNNKPYETLFYNLTDQEATEIMGKLQEKGVTYKYETPGTILVPQEQEEQLRAELVYEGYPKHGFSYDIIMNNIDMTTSESEKQKYYLMELQDRLGATISLFPNIKDAKLNIALGEDRKYVLDSQNMTKSSASVTVITDNGDMIDEECVRAIQRAVSSSVPDLEFGKVTVVCNGKDVTIAEERSAKDANDLKFQMEQIIDEKIEAKVMAMLEPIYGEGRVRVSVNSEVDVNKKIRELVNYSPEDAKNTGVISSQKATQEVAKDGKGTGGVPGTETNADFPIYTRIEQDGSETYILSDGGAEYLVDQLKEQQQIDTGDLTDLTVGVIIDGEDTGDTTEAKLKSLVAKAAGISRENQDEKIEIVTVPFYTEGPVEEPPKPLIDPVKLKQGLLLVGIAGGILLILLLVLMLLIKRRKRKRLEREMAEERQNQKNTIPNILQPNTSEEDQSKLNLDMIADLLDIKNERSMELKEKIRDITDESPEISAQTLRNWLRGGKNDGK